MAHVEFCCCQFVAVILLQSLCCLFVCPSFLFSWIAHKQNELLKGTVLMFVLVLFSWIAQKQNELLKATVLTFVLCCPMSCWSANRVGCESHVMQVAVLHPKQTGWFPLLLFSFNGSKLNINCYPRPCELLLTSKQVTMSRPSELLLTNKQVNFLLKCGMPKVMWLAILN